MEKIITPEMLAKIPFGTPMVTIASKRITFNKSATLALKLENGNSFLLVLKHGSLHYKEAVNGAGFTIHSNRNIGVVNNALLYKYLGLKEKTQYQIMEFKDGMRELREIKKVKK